MARERGIALELTYAGGVREGSLRRYLFACGVAVMRMGGGGKGVVVSSGAEREMEMRDVAGVVSVMRLMGMEGERARDALSTNAEAGAVEGRDAQDSQGSAEGSSSDRQNAYAAAAAASAAAAAAGEGAGR